MKELIEEAEKLYEEIDTIQMLWVASTKDNDEEGIRYAIGRMSVAMCSAMQLLKCFIDRKDNIVDLSEAWKDGKVEKPLPYSEIVVRDCCITTNHEDVVDESQWAYIDDLLPKGGEEWNTTK